MQVHGGEQGHLQDRVGDCLLPGGFEKSGHAVGQSVQGGDLVVGQRAVEARQLVEAADEFYSEPELGEREVPRVLLLPLAQGAAKLAVEVEFCDAGLVSVVELLPRENDVRPPVSGERRILHFDQGALRNGNFVVRFVRRIPRQFIGKHAETAGAGIFDSEFEKETCVECVARRDLDRIGVAWFEVFVGRSAQPERNAALPIVCRVGEVVLHLVKNARCRRGFESQVAAKASVFLPVLEIGGVGVQSGFVVHDRFAGGHGVESGITVGQISAQVGVERGVKGECLAKRGSFIGKQGRDDGRRSG